MKICILSPHIDDAAFGLTLTISKLVARKIPVTIINCFTITKWTGVFVSKEIEAVTQLRKQEDAAFNKLFNSQINIINLDLLDAPLRNGYIIQNKPFEPNEWDLVEYLKNYLEANADGILLCPLAIGSHIDHAISREAVLQVYKKMQVLFYEDLPYTYRITPAQADMHIRDLAKQLNVKLESSVNASENAVANKEQAIRLYGSQVNDEICTEIISYMKVLGGERIWGEAIETDLFASIFKD